MSAKFQKTFMETLISETQTNFCKALEQVDGQAKFHRDEWSRNENGGKGVTAVIQNGKVIEKGGVNTSIVYGKLPKEAAMQMRARKADFFQTADELKFYAAGISTVIHPWNPHCPTMHFNYRYFEVENEAGEKKWWFGGGTDLTPTFLNEQDVIHFHTTLKSACDKHNDTFYPKFKKWCDEYFVIKHRGEARGVGGIFFDDLTDEVNNEKDFYFNFITSCANSVIPCYIPILEKNKEMSYSFDDRQWQLLRRGRYVEFNLVYDRGTKFGLLTPNARIESILMSLPLYAKFEYEHNTEDKEINKIIQVLKNLVYDSQAHSNNQEISYAMKIK